jgi:hypothetical protein
MVFNLSNELAFKFNLCVFGDKSSDLESRTSYSTLKQVIYLETDKERFEISRVSISDETQDGLFTFAKVLNPEELDNEYFSQPSTQIPLELSNKETIFEGIQWHDFVWSDNSLRVKDS